MSLLMALATEIPPPACEVNPEVPGPLSDLIMRLLAKNQNDRPASALEVIAALAEVEVPAPSSPTVAVESGEQPPASEATLALPSVSPAGARRRFRWAVAAAVLLALLPLGYFFGGTIIRFATNQGELVINVDDPGVEIKIVQNGVMVQDKTSKREFTLTAGKGQIEVFEKEGIGPLATKQFALNRGGKTTVRVTFQELADARKPKSDPQTEAEASATEGDPDRRAAEYVLSIGGRISVQLNDQDRGIAAVADLPTEPFRLTMVDLNQNPKLTDAGLAHFQDCKNVTHLLLGGTQVSDAGLARFQDFKNLLYLYLADTRVTDAGLALLQDCKDLTYLNLGFTRVSDAAVETFLKFPRLLKLELHMTRLSHYGFEQLKAALPECQINCSEPNRLAAEQVLALGGSVEIGAPGQEAQAVQPNEPLPQTFFQLRRLALKDCKQPPGELPAALGQLKFPEFDRLEAVDFTGMPLTDLGFLASIHGLKDVVLARMGLGDQQVAALPNVRRLVLDGNAIRGPGLEALAKQAELVELSLAGAALTDEDLARLPTLPQLNRLTLDGNALRGPGLRRLAEPPQLKELSLACPSLWDAGARNLAGLKSLTRLSLATSSIRDAGLKHLEGLTNLTELDLSGTQVSAEGVAALQKALPKCTINWDGGND